MARPRLKDVVRTPSGQISRSRASYQQRGLLPHDGYVVYFAKSSDRVKIGYTGSTKSRMATVSTMQGRPVRVVGLAHVASEKLARALESKMHERFAPHRIEGEWFDLTMSDVLLPLNECRRLGIRTTGGVDASEDVPVLSGLAYAPDY